MIDPAGNRGGHSSTGGAPAPSFGCRFRPPAVEDSPALSNGAGHSSLLLLSSPRINRTRRLPSPCRTHITTASIALWSLRASLNFSTLGASLPPPRRGPASAHSFRDRLVPISECECDKASQDLAGEQGGCTRQLSSQLQALPHHFYP